MTAPTADQLARLRAAAARIGATFDGFHVIAPEGRTWMMTETDSLTVEAHSADSVRTAIADVKAGFAENPKEIAR